MIPFRAQKEQNSISMIKIIIVLTFVGWQITGTFLGPRSPFSCYLLFLVWSQSLKAYSSHGPVSLQSSCGSSNPLHTRRSTHKMAGGKHHLGQSVGSCNRHCVSFERKDLFWIAISEISGHVVRLHCFCACWKAEHGRVE